MEEENKKKKKFSKKQWVLIAIIFIVIIAVGITIFYINISSNKQIETYADLQSNSENNSSRTENNNNAQYTVEQIQEILTSNKDKNGKPLIISLAEIRLKNELKYIDINTTYIFQYNYKAIDDMVNFYMVIPKMSDNMYGINFYDICSYQASYGITDKTIEYFQNYENLGDIKISDLFNINIENKVMHASAVQSEALGSYISDAKLKASNILDYDPTGKRQKEKAEKSKEELINKIKKEIEIENNYSKTNFQPTEAQMEDILKHFNYKVENFNSLAYGTYIVQNNWFAINPNTGTYYTEPINESSQTQQDSQSSSSSTTDSNGSDKTNNATNNNDSSTNDTETYQTQQITATLDIKIKELIDKNTTAQEIVKSDNIYLRTEVKINGDTVDFDGKSYYGSNEIPNTITKEYDATLTEDNPVAKVTVIIQIYDNTAETETTLYNKDITIDKTSIYEIR